MSPMSFWEADITAWEEEQERAQALKLELLKKKWENYEGGNLNKDHCPGCGFLVSSHILGSWGLDCPWGLLPETMRSRMPTRINR